MALVRAIRGAATVGENDAKQIVEAAKGLLSEMMHRNNLCEENLISILFTVTTDLDQAFPARAARELGLTQPADVRYRDCCSGSLSRCIQ